MPTAPTKKQPVAGLTVEIQKIGASRYGYVRHNASGLRVISCERGPLKHGVNAFLASIAEHLSGYDWTKDADHFAALSPVVSQMLRETCATVCRENT